MKTSRTTVAVAILVCAFLFGGGGIAVGYVWGYVDSGGLNAPVNSATIATALRAYRRGEHENAISLLESGLDGAMMERWSYDLRSHPLAGLVGDNQVKVRVLSFAADYRSEVPSAAPSEDVRGAVAEVAARYKSAK
jgi:hypothetical protein